VKDARGDLFVKEAWRECVKRCSGRVIVVKCSDSVNFGYAQDSRKNRKDRELDKLFGENGAVVDLHSDPLGWNSDCGLDVNAAAGISPKQFKGIATKLQSILSVVQEAANFISSQTPLKENTAIGENASIQPIPVIFDSISPLLLHHGVEKMTILFSRLKQTFITSPIFIPTLSETLPPAGNRMLEEYADAVLTLSGGKLLIAKRSARVGGMVCGGFSGGLRLTKDEQHFEIGGNSNDLVLLKKGSEPNNTRTKETKSDLADVEKGTKRLNLQDVPAKQAVLANENNFKQRPVLRHEDDASDRSTTQEVAPKPTPRIYMEEDDPEFDDLDEEDPDDDLDI